MKQFIILLILSISIHTASAQINVSYAERPSAYFNNFQLFTEEHPDADSAVYYLKKLASKKEYGYMLGDLLHNSFAQSFLRKDTANETAAQHKHQLLSNQILAKAVADTGMLLQQAMKPLYLWKTAQEHKENPARLAEISREFINTQLAGDIYINKAGRYGMMIYQIIATQPSLKDLAAVLLEKVSGNLQNNQVALTDSISRLDLMKRAWYRYMFAYCNYVKAQQGVDKAALLKEAYDYSPDLTDKNNLSGYFYDAVFLFGDEGKQTFKPDYLDYMAANSNDKPKILSMLLQTALIDPEYKSKLENFYNSTNKTATSFNQYWLNAINTSAKPAPPIALSLLDNKTYSGKQQAGKWILVDFWGTWCGPCRAEHPAVQQFYDSVIMANPKKISFITIACRDTKEKVLKYLAEKKYTFPVAMSDGKIEHNFIVQGYPTKLLITPQGKYITIPFGGDWENFIKQYCSL